MKARERATRWETCDAGLGRTYQCLPLCRFTFVPVLPSKHVQFSHIVYSCETTSGEVVEETPHLGNDETNASCTKSTKPVRVEGLLTLGALEG